MGVWGAALYSSDFAMDLRGTIGAVLRLPFETNRLVEILCECESASENPQAEEHTTFWLIVADQFSRRGVLSDRVRERAMEIIDRGEDLAMMESLGMTPPDLRKRKRMLDELRERIITPAAAKSRKVLREPQPLLMDFGDLIIYPTCHGRCTNPYIAPGKPDVSSGHQWIQNDWGAAVVIDCGRAFEFLSWYRPLTLAYSRGEKPDLDALRGNLLWRLERPGTCSPAHFKRMQLEKLGNFPADKDKLQTLFPNLKPGISAAVNDISIANRLKAIPHVSRPNQDPDIYKARLSTIIGIAQILKS